MQDMPVNRFKRALAERRPQIGFWLTLESPTATEIAATAGYDWLLLDLEHTANTLASIGHHVLAARGGSAELVVRIPSVDPVLTKNLLDAGVRSIMYPYVDTVEQARLAAAATRYPPHGIRGVAGNMRGSGFGRYRDYLARSAEEICVVVQVETPRAVEAIAGIGAVDGIDGIFVGPNDLSANMGLLGRSDAPEVRAKIAEARTRILATGKAAGILNFKPAEAKALLADGFSFIAVGSDSSLLIRHTDDLRAEFG